MHHKQMCIFLYISALVWLILMLVSLETLTHFAECFSWNV